MVSTSQSVIELVVEQLESWFDAAQIALSPVVSSSFNGPACQKQAYALALLFGVVEKQRNCSDGVNFTTLG